MTKKKKKTKEKRSKKKSQSRDFFKANWNDEVYVQRTIAKKGGIGGSKVG